MYDAYKPFRNYMRRFGQASSLFHVWRLHHHLLDDAPLPREMGPPPKPWRERKLNEHVWPWDLDILAREIVMHGDPTGQRPLEAWNDLAQAITHVRRLDNIATQQFLEAGGDIMREMHRLVHRQFPWQRGPNRNSLLRYMRIFEDGAVAPIVERQTGLTVLQTYRMGFAVAGGLSRRPGLTTHQDYTSVGVEPEASKTFFARITSSLAELKAATTAQQRYDGAWLYAWNPLRERPLIGIDPAHPERVICPLPTFVMRRISEGLYYDLVGTDAFGEAFGRAFERHVGDVLRLACPAPRFEVFGETPYWIGKQRKDGVDWILQDAEASLFIECKTSRLRIDAKIDSDTVALAEAFDRLAGAVAQHYKNMHDALQGLTAWKPTDRPCYPLVVTLEDWWIFNPTLRGMLDKAIQMRLEAHGLDPSLIERQPYTLASAAELETALQIIAEVGIERFMREKTTAETRDWAISPFASTVFGGTGKPHDFFEAEWRRIGLED